MGDGSIVPSLLHAYVESTLLAPNRAELLFRSVDYAPAASDLIPDTAQICNCNAVSKAQIIESVLAGARSLSAVCAATRAGTGCGSCKPEVQEIIELACRGLTDPEVLAAADRSPATGVVSGLSRTLPPHPSGDVVVTLNKIERIKREKDVSRSKNRASWGSSHASST